MAAPTGSRRHAVRGWDPQRHAQGVAQGLRRGRWLRLHVFGIALLSLLALLAAGTLLRTAGVQHLGLRWALALPLAYGAYLLLLRAWAQSLLDRSSPLDALNADVAPGSGGGGGCEPPVPGPRSGGGGDFGGAGGGGDFGPADAGGGLGDAAGTALQKAGAVLDGADEAVVLVVPLALLAAVLALLAGLLGTGVLMVFGVDVLLAVVVEVVLASLAGTLAYQGAREGWLGTALAHTWRGALLAWLLALALGSVLQAWLPHARSLPHALRLLLG